MPASLGKPALWFNAIVGKFPAERKTRFVQESRFQTKYQAEKHSFRFDSPQLEKSQCTFDVHAAIRENPNESNGAKHAARFMMNALNLFSGA